MKKNTEFNPQSFAVVGAGPVGCILAAFLAKGGREVTLCDVRAALIEPATDPGIVIEGAEEIRQAVSNTTRSIDELARYDPDVVFVTTKANTLPLIASAIQDFYRKGMYVVSWQNGIDTELEIARVLGKEASMRAVVNYGCNLVGPAHVRMAFHHPPHYLQELAPQSRDAAVVIAETLTACGLETNWTDQIVPMVWRKSVMNASLNPVCALTGLTIAGAVNDPIVFQTVDAVLKECIKVGRANEILLGWDYYPYCVEYLRTAGDHKPSMLIDVENNRRTEIDLINGKFVEYGVRAGIETPHNTMLTALVKGLESA